MIHEAPSEEEIRKFYRETLKPVLGKFEKLRIRLAYSSVVIFPLAVAAVGALIYRSDDRFVGTIKWVLLSPIVFLAVATVCTLVFMIFDRGFDQAFDSLKGKAFRWEFKGEVIAKICEFVDPGFTYEPKGYVEEAEYMGCGIFEPPKLRYSGEDLIEGFVGDTRIRFCEVLAISYRDEGNFNGLFFVADFNRRFSGTTVVLPDLFERSLGRIGRKFQNLRKRWGELIHMEDPEFEELFGVKVVEELNLDNRIWGRMGVD